MEQSKSDRPQRNPMRRRTMIEGDTFTIEGREYKVKQIGTFGICDEDTDDDSYRVVYLEVNQ